jgi:hypothetical protein
MNKTCTTCNTIKLLSEFYKGSSNPDGLQYHCKNCDRIKRHQHKLKNLEQTRIQARKNAKKHRLKFPTKNRSDMLQYKYGITLDDFNKMFKEQNGVCKICKRESYMYDERIKGMKNLAVDHCHKTGKVRGLLCTKCNQGLGNFEDNIESFNNAIIYLKETL